MKKVLLIFGISLFAFGTTLAVPKDYKQESLGGGWYCLSGCDLEGQVYKADIKERDENGTIVHLSIQCQFSGSCVTIDSKGFMTWHMDKDYPTPHGDADKVVTVVPELPHGDAHTTVYANPAPVIIDYKFDFNHPVLEN